MKFRLFSFVLERNWSFRIHVCRFSYHLSAVPLSPVSLSDSRNDAKTSQLELTRAWSGKGPSSRSSFFGSVFTIVAVTILRGAWNRLQYSSHFMCWNICHVTFTSMFIHVSPIWNVNHPRNWGRKEVVYTGKHYIGWEGVKWKIWMDSFNKFEFSFVAPIHFLQKKWGEGD